MFKDLVDFNLPVNEAPIISVIGIGGGGCNAVNRMCREGIRDVGFLVLNTDKLALDASPVEKKIQLGATLTEGRGSGNRSDVGEQAAIECMGEIIDGLKGGTRMAFLVAGMGKGTGTGAAPVVARICRDLNILTVGVVTLPFTIEGPSRKLQALQGVNRLKDEVDALLIIHNEKLREMYGNLSLGDAFKKADDILLLAVKGIAEIITVHGYINVDFADVQSVMTEGGIAFMGSATAAGTDRAQKVIDETINSPLLNSNDIRGASRVLLNITSGRDEVTVDEVGRITDIIMERVGGMVNVIWGTCTDDSLKDEVRITLVATGFSQDAIPDWISLNPPARSTVGLGSPPTPGPEGMVREGPARIPEAGRGAAQQGTPFTVKETGTVRTPEVAGPAGPARSAAPAMAEETARPVETSGPRNPDAAAPDLSLQDETDKIRTERLKALNYRNLANPDKLDEVERIPAYKRKNLPVEQQSLFEEENQSRLTLGKDAKLRPNNPYLHDVVD